MLRGVLFGILLFGAACLQVVPAQSLGSIGGTVVGDDGALLAASVTANRSGQPPASGRAIAGPGGAFTIANLPAGTYSLCAAVKGRGYLDPCTWSPFAPTVQVGPGQTVKGFRLIVKKGAIVQVRLSDAAGALSAVAAAKQTAPHALVGIWTARRLFEPLVLTGKDATGRNHEGTIPLNTPVPLHISGKGVEITDAAGVRLDRKASSVTR